MHYIHLQQKLIKNINNTKKKSYNFICRFYNQNIKIYNNLLNQNKKFLNIFKIKIIYKQFLNILNTYVYMCKLLSELVLLSMMFHLYYNKLKNVQKNYLMEENVVLFMKNY